MFSKKCVASKLLTCAVVLAPSVLFAAKAPPVGTVYVKTTMDCNNMTDSNGFSMCSISSNGGGYDANLAYQTVTSMTLPYGTYMLTGKVLDYAGSNPLSPWVVAECVLVSGTQIVDYSSDNWGGYVNWAGSVPGLEYLFLAPENGAPIPLHGTLNVTAPAGSTVSIACRVQGQAVGQNADGSFYSPAPIKDIRFNGPEIMALAVGSVIKLTR